MLKQNNRGHYKDRKTLKDYGTNKDNAYTKHFYSKKRRTKTSSQSEGIFYIAIFIGILFLINFVFKKIDDFINDPMTPISLIIVFVIFALFMFFECRKIKAKKRYTKAMNLYNENLYTEAFETFSLVSKKFQNPAANFSLGYLYEHGLGTEKDIEKAKEFYQKAANKKHIEAMYQLGILLYNTESIKEKQAGLDFLKKSHQKKYFQATLELAILYSSEKEVSSPLYYKRIFNKINKAAQKGNKDLYFYIGQFYLDGIITEQDFSKAVTWFRKSAENNDKNGMLMYAKCLSEGIGITKNEEQAQIWLEKAEQG